MERRFYVYVVFRLDGSPCYVGKGCGYRWKSHLAKSHSVHLANILRQAGGELPIAKIRESLTNDEACVIEVALIAAIGREIDGGPLVNLTPGGEGVPGFRHSENARKTMNASKKGTKQSQETIERRRASNTGLKRSAETKERIRAAHTGAKRSPEWCENIRRSKMGQIRSAETRAKIAAASTGRKRTPEVIAKTADALRGIPRPPEVREKLRAANLGKRQSDEAKAKLRAAFSGKKRVLTAEHIANIRAAVQRREHKRKLVTPVAQSLCRESPQA